VVTTTNDTILPTVIAEVKAVRSDVPIVVRVEEVEDVHALSTLKVEEVVQPQLEVGLEMVRQSLLALQIDESQIFAVLGQLRADRYEPGRFLGGGGGGEESVRLLQASRFLELVWVEVTPASDFSGMSLQGSRLRERFGVSVVGIMRGADFVPTPAAEAVLIQGDLLAVLGTRSQLQALREMNLRI
jgi:K+/H+ antiporter YhaU regulatory subunit KhtT